MRRTDDRLQKRRTYTRGNPPDIQSMMVHRMNRVIFPPITAIYGEPESVPILETDKTVPTKSPVWLKLTSCP